MRKATSFYGVEWELLHPRATFEHLGALPQFLHIADERPAAEQFQERYVFGGWRPMKGWTGMTPEGNLSYTGDPVMKPIAKATLLEEVIYLYESSFVGIRQPDGGYEVARMD